MKCGGLVATVAPEPVARFDSLATSRDKTTYTAKNSELGVMADLSC